MSVAKILEDARELHGDIVQLRHDLHRHPELGLDLPRTQEKVLEALADLPLEITLGKGLTSVGAVLRGTAGDPVRRADRPTVLLRADMDALPLQEETGVDFTSTWPTACMPAATTCTRPCWSAPPACWPSGGTSWPATSSSCSSPAENSSPAHR